jgi:ATP-dependent exoDNAse (exonuclease V) alpha subunit
LTEKFGFARLSEITRQKTAEGLDLANTFYEGSHQKRGERTGRQALAHGRALYKKMDDMGALHQFEDGKAAIDGLVKAYLASPRKSSEKLAIAATNVDVHEIARGIRKGLKDRGELDGDDYNATVVTAAGGNQRLPVAVHDRIRFFAKVGDHSGDKAATNEDATILGIERNQLGGLNIKVRMDELAENGSERIFVFDSYEHDNWGYAYATTAHKSQGQTTDECFWLGSSASNHHLGLVAATRAKHRLDVFIDQETASGFASTLGRHSFKANALEEGAQQVRTWASNITEQVARLKTATAEMVDRLFGPTASAPDHIQNQKLKNQQPRGMTR